MPSSSLEIEKTAFLGPKGENAEEFERLLLEVLHDHVFWRRNFHPGDPRLIAERDKSTDAYRERVAVLRDELFQILAELKRGAPVYSPRQVAHMVADPTMPALVGYFTGMLYNQNNVVAEVAPETTRKERAYMAALARMIGYPEFIPEQLPRKNATSYGWGHLTSGGTGANLEALWVVRNVRLMPLALRLYLAEGGDAGPLQGIDVRCADGRSGELSALSTYELFNLPVAEILRLHTVLRRTFGDRFNAFRKQVPSVRRLGVAGFMHRYNAAFTEDRLGMPRVLVSQAAHYGWYKIMDLIGLGSDALVKLPVDRRMRLDAERLEETLHEAARDETPILSVISICGTTEEGAIDPLHRVDALREKLASEGLTFWHHADAAMGGFYPSMLERDEQGGFLPYDHASEELKTDLDRDVYDGIAALSRTDSVTIDPHKFGYVPYPCGTILFRQHEVRDFVSYEAPYLDDDEEPGFGGFLGRWTLEGSRPGAAAVSCYLSQAVVPLDAEGHGSLLRSCIEINKKAVRALEVRFLESDNTLRLVPLAEPDTTGFCFFVAPADRSLTLAELNDFNHEVWTHLTVDGAEQGSHYDFLLSKTELDLPSYAHVLDPLLEPLGIDTSEKGALMLLRSCVMNPLIKQWNERTPSFDEAFAAHLHEVADAAWRQYRRRHTRNGQRQERTVGR